MQLRVEYGAIGKVNFKRKTYLEYDVYSKYSDERFFHNMITMVNKDTLAMTLKTFWNAEQRFCLLSNKDSFSKEDIDSGYEKIQYFRIKEWESVRFAYPIIILIKGGREILLINLLKALVSYT